MKRSLLSATTAAFAIVALGTSLAAADTTVSVPAAGGNVVAAASSGMTLYTFRNDAANVSNCYDSCADAWPPFTAGASATASGNLGIIDRNDGTRQWTMDGKPLYFWQGDQQRGDATGDGVGGVWDVVRG